MKIGMHRILQTDLTRLATGAGDVTTLLHLCEVERSKHILLLHSVIAEASRRFPQAHKDLRLADAWQLLQHAQQKDPDSLGNILQMPQLGAWALNCLQHLRRAVRDTAELREDLVQAGAFAAVAALQTGLDFEVPVTLPDGILRLPGSGETATPVRGPAWLRHSAGQLDVVTAEKTVRLPPPQPLILSARHAGLTLVVDVDTSTPYLDRYHHSRLARIGREEVRQWSERLAGAWRILATHHREDAEAISVSVRTVVPLRADRTGSSLAATSPSAFGAVAASLPPDDLALAETMVHEFQHLKLCAVQDLLPLLDSGKDKLAYAPWRDDPRPLRGLLHGAYAYLGVTRFWRVQRLHMPAGQTMRGHAEYARRRDETLRVLDDLLTSGGLTAEGRDFVTEAGNQLRGWLRDPVPESASRLARHASREHRLTWEARHVTVEPAHLRQLVSRWTAGRPPPASGTGTVTYRPGKAGRVRLHPRALLLTLRYVDPPKAEELLDEEGEDGRGPMGLSQADLALLRGELSVAVAAYLADIGRRPTAQPDAWAGLALALEWSSHPVADALDHRLSLVAALHAALHTRTGRPADPLELIGWLAGREGGDDPA
ncbi:HEXXH motif domain-containing protein [Streptomyces prunicolor]|uniref:HEXXH motif domain-containing protein n=1 Tax=Streptomyces prunicolor TaxID=67348 RepID=UPI0037D178A9